MLFYQLIKRLTIDILFFAALLLNLFFMYTQMVPFLNSAISLHYVNAQTVSYMIYTLLLTFLPLVLIMHNVRIEKGQALRILFYAFAAIIFFGTVSDLVVYKLFIGYTYTEGDAVFINTIWNMPSLLGAVFSFIIAGLYAALGKLIKRRRRISCVLYITILLLTSLVPFIYTYLNTGYLPRQTYLEKAALILPEQLLISISLVVAATSRQLWKQHIWDY